MTNLPEQGPVSVYHLDAWRNPKNQSPIDYPHPHAVIARRLKTQAQNERYEAGRADKNAVDLVRSKSAMEKRKKDKQKAQDKVDRDLMREPDDPVSEDSEESVVQPKKKPGPKASTRRLANVDPEDLELPEPKPLPSDFPPSDLLQTIHTHTRDYFVAESMYKQDDRPNKKALPSRNMYAALNGSALLAIAVLMEEYTKHLISQPETTQTQPLQAQEGDIDMDDNLPAV